MSSFDDVWSIPPLDSADQRLVDAYKAVGKTVEELPYTPEFHRLCSMIGADETDDARHMVFRRLLRLRKMGRLPRLGLLAE
jgi:saccharopine dehydrogenase-like NADP-dependent oxidoreductase